MAEERARRERAEATSQWLRRQRPAVHFTEGEVARFIAEFDVALRRDPTARRSDVALRVLEALERSAPGGRVNVPINEAPTIPPELASLLKEALRADPGQRVAYRARIEAFGGVAIPPMLAWLGVDGCDELASFVLRTLANRGHAQEVLDGVDELCGRGHVADRERVGRLRSHAAMAVSRPAPLPPEVQIWRSKIEATRRRLGLAPLTGTDLKHLVMLAHAAADNPDAYRNHCWNCRAPVVEGVHRRCRCGWLECFCGACVSPRFGHCAIGAARFPDEFLGDVF